MTDKQFIEAVATMRRLQIAFFDARKKDNHSASQILQKCKDAERAVDKRIKELQSNQPAMF
jgi:ferritin